MRHESRQTQVESMYEQAMETVFGHARDVECMIGDLGCLVDKFINEDAREEADEIIDKILVSLDRIC